MKACRAFLCCLFALVLSAPSGAQSSWPTRPIRLIVPYTAGGQFDIVARMVAAGMGERLGQPVVVENRPGADTMIGAEYVARAPNDGYTLLYAGANMFAIAPNLYRKMSYKVGDFETISLVSELPMGLIVNGDVPAKTLGEFIAYVKANPGKLNYGTSGDGGAQHLLCELFKEKAGLDMTHISYKGTSQVIQDLLPGRVVAACDGLQSYIPHAKAGKVRLLAVSSSKRLQGLPDVPTFAELGIPAATVASWGGVVAPAGTPAPVIDKLRAAVVAAASAPSVREKIASDAAVPRTSTGREFDALIQHDSKKWKAVIDRLGLQRD